MSRSYKFTNLIDLATYMSDEKACKQFLADLRWKDGIICPHCGHDGKIYTLKSSYKCSSCKQPFSETKGTIFENSAVPLCKWFVAIWMITTNKRGVSSTQLSRDIDVTQKTAWSMIKRIRSANHIVETQHEQTA